MRPLAPKGGNDRVYTPPWLAAQIISHFNPTGRILEPCRGSGQLCNGAVKVTRNHGRVCTIIPESTLNQSPPAPYQAQ